MSEIKVLSKEVSELIAAGEVIDRPASIIKELLENSIDAGANIITVEIKNGGRTYIRVTDNGKGISESDISKAFLRHATSKISAKTDLDKILTLGFRGEALASITAVSRVEVFSKPADEDYGTHYIIEGSEEKLCEKSGCPDGTTFVVRDIFYNVPARLKFLKKDVTEANYTASYVSKIALSHPEISFKFIRDNKVDLLTAGDGKLYSDIYAVFGKEFAKSLIPVQYKSNDICVHGYISKPLYSKNNRKFQNYFVNGRYIKSLTCGAALEEAYKNNIMTGKFPACVLNIEISPNIVDVNVHPTKIEVRFSDNRIIYEAIYFAVKNALLNFDKPNEIKFDTKKNFTSNRLYGSPFQNEQGSQLKFVEKSSAVKTQYQDSPVNDDKTKYNTQTISTFEPIHNDIFSETISPDEGLSSTVETKKPSIEVEESLLTETSFNAETIEEATDFKYIKQDSFRKRESVVEEATVKPKAKPIVIGELFKTYIIAQAGDEMLMFDKHAAHERYLFEKIKNDLNQLEPQMLLEPVMVLLSYEEYDAINDNIDTITQLGFAVEADVAPTVAVMGIPMVLGNDNPSEIISELAKNFLEFKHNPQLDVFDELYHSIACKAAIKANDNSGLVELQALVNAVYDDDNIRYCPHGRPVMIELSKKDIEKQFKRIV